MATLLVICPAPVMVLIGKLNPGAVPPVSSAVHMENTLWLWKKPNIVGLLINAAVQFPGVQNPVPESAASKKGCGASPASVLAGVAARHAASETVHPMAFSTLA